MTAAAIVGAGVGVTSTTSMLSSTSSSSSLSARDGRIVSCDTSSPLEKYPLKPRYTKGGSDLPQMSEGVTTKRMYYYKEPTKDRHSNKNVSVFASPNSKLIGNDVTRLMGIPLSESQISAYNDGETNVKIVDSVRGRDCYFLVSTADNVSLIETLLTISTMRRASAKSITAVVPFFGYQRQDRKMRREPIAAADVAKMFETMGVDKVICMDLHNDSLRGFFDVSIGVDHLQPGPIAASYMTEVLLEEGGPDDLCVVSPHEGQVERGNQFRKRIAKLSGVENVPIAFVSKQKPHGSDTVEEATIVGDVSGKRCIVVDDILDTGGTMLKTIQLLKEGGAKKIYAYVTHGVFSDPQLMQKIQTVEGLEFLLITNSLTKVREKKENIFAYREDARK